MPHAHIFLFVFLGIYVNILFAQFFTQGGGFSCIAFFPPPHGAELYQLSPRASDHLF